MKKALRLTLIVSAAALALAFAGSALAAYTPKLLVHTNHKVGSGGPVTIAVSATKEEDATALSGIYVPLGYTLKFDQAPGTNLGAVTAHVQALGISADTILPLEGTVTVANQADPALVPAVAACTRTPAGTPHAAVWVLVLTAAGQTLRVPVTLDAITAGPATEFASAKLSICLPSPYIPATAGGATFGAKLLDATFTMDGVFNNPTSRGNFIWRATFTPYTTGSGAPNAAGTVEARSEVRLPSSLSLKAKVVSKKKHTVVLSGRLSEGGTGIGGVTVALLVGKAKVSALKAQFTTKTNANGSFGGGKPIKVGKKGGKFFFQVKASVKDRVNTATACSTPGPFNPVPCVSSTISGGYSVASIAISAKA
jgi:hypothetical protein